MAVIAEAEVGRLLGDEQETRAGGVVRWLGVPYADPATPRFAPPGPAPEVSSPWDARRSGPPAPQSVWQPGQGSAAAIGSEKGCLTLNIWSPRGDGGRPVLVWIHGGANIGGSNIERDAGLLAASADVVVVAINYRLGVLGFLSFEHLLGSRAAVNPAVEDQLAALRWVRSNITAFGGDPDDITIAGQSAGAASVAVLLASPHARGLVRRAVLQSGTAERVHTGDENAAVVDELLDALGIPASDAERLLQFGTAELLDAQAAVLGRHAARTVGLPLPFQVVLDGRLVPVVPLEGIRNGAGSDVDVLAGTARDEAAGIRMFGGWTESPETLLERLLGMSGVDAPIQEYRRAAEEALGRRLPGEELLEAAVTDVSYRQPTNRLLQARAGATARTFSYLFTEAALQPGGRRAAFHSSDLDPLFGTVSYEDDGAAGGLGVTMRRAWGAFASTGEPAAPLLSSWPEYGPDQATMILNSSAHVERAPLEGLRRFWSRAVA